MTNKYPICFHENIFEVDAYFPECHASTLVWLEPDILLCAWFGGTHEKHDDVAIWYSIRRSGKWSPPKVACDTPEIPCWNPALFSQDQKQALLYFKSGKTIPGWRTYISKYDIASDTWSDIKELVQGDIGGRGPVKNKPIRLSDDTVLAPASIETSESWEAYVDLSTDGGYTFESFVHIPLDRTKLTGKGVIQPSCWESEPGHVHMLIRSTEGCLFRSDSVDFGRTWCKAYPTTLANNNSGIDLTKLPDGTLLLLCNPIAENWGKRNLLTLLSSKDNGQTWTEEAVIEKDEQNKSSEFSYPAIIYHDNKVYASYTWKRKSISFIELSL